MGVGGTVYALGGGGATRPLGKEEDLFWSTETIVQEGSGEVAERKGKQDKYQNEGQGWPNPKKESLRSATTLNLKTFISGSSPKEQNQWESALASEKQRRARDEEGNRK